MKHCKASDNIVHSTAPVSFHNLVVNIQERFKDGSFLMLLNSKRFSECGV